MTRQVNSFFSILLITIVGAGAVLLIMHTSNITTTVAVFGADKIIYTY